MAKLLTAYSLDVLSLFSYASSGVVVVVLDFVSPVHSAFRISVYSLCCQHSFPHRLHPIHIIYYAYFSGKIGNRLPLVFLAPLPFFVLEGFYILPVVIKNIFSCLPRSCSVVSIVWEGGTSQNGFFRSSCVVAGGAFRFDCPSKQTTTSFLLERLWCVAAGRVRPYHTRFFGDDDGGRVVVKESNDLRSILLVLCTTVSRTYVRSKMYQ